MNGRVGTIVLISAMGVASLASGSAMAGTGAPAAALGIHAWHTAIEVPGTAALNRRGDAQITSVSCASAGNCSAGGFYDGSQGSVASGQAFVVSQVNGTWHTAIEVPGTAALNQGGVAAGLPPPSRCRAARRATAAPPGTTGIVPERQDAQVGA